MCINTKLENENWDATNSWSGYNYQGKIALFVVFKKINELISRADAMTRFQIDAEMENIFWNWSTFFVFIR